MQKKSNLIKNMLKFDEKTDLDYIQQTKVYEIKSILEKTPYRRTVIQRY